MERVGGDESPVTVEGDEVMAGQFPQCASRVYRGRFDHGTEIALDGGGAGGGEVLQDRAVHLPQRVR